jgi:hydrogenase maturation protein HypF
MPPTRYPTHADIAIATPHARSIELLITGQVQGVGFRPFVYRLATDLGLTGSVRNDPAGVTVLLHGDSHLLDAFSRRLTAEHPPLARIDSVQRRDLSSAPAPDSFCIIPSEHTGRPDRVTVDSATCPDCLRELFDPSDRRFNHPLINCTNCGPRYTIVSDVPYDRPLTTMAGFPMCARCEAEYRNPADRRFHAQPTCCNNCGPRLSFIGPRSSPDPITAAADLLQRGGILAIKGLGGYHLAVDATNPAAVDLLRSRKRRDHKPLAIMVDFLATAQSLVELSPQAIAAITSPVAPIILATRRPRAPIAPSVAPGMHRLGVMLPHTPIQHLLVRKGFSALVMTSANLSDDPLITDDDDARARLASIADAFLFHDRPIARAVDDSILLDAPLGLLPIRRARGLVPTPISLPIPAPEPGLALGGELKSTIALITGDHAVLSQHLGDLNHALAYRRFRTTINDLARLYRVEPRWIARDAHPAYLSHRFAAELSRRLCIPVIDVQHHHAHLAAVLAEHGRTDRAVGIICDGVGYGSDGQSWGGEILVGDRVSFERTASLRSLRLPGGDAAARQTGRCALSWLTDACGPDITETPIARRLLPNNDERSALAALLSRNLNCPPSSGLGRLFDAAAALLGVCDYNHFEAMSGMTLEALATQADACPDTETLIPFTQTDNLTELDHRPLARRLLSGLQRGEPTASLARFFHESIARALATAAQQAAEHHKLHTCVLSGGVFCNALLTSLVHHHLTSRGLEVLIHREVPPNDGGLALGQAAIASARLSARPQRA